MPATASPALPLDLAERRESLSKNVYDRIKAAIFDFAMMPGQRYAEQALAERFEVSRTPLRLALHLLAHEGFMQNLGGHACWQVAPLNLDFYEDVYDFRMEIEAIALRRACAKAAPDVLAALKAVWAVPKKQRERDGAVVGQLDERFHRDLVAMAGNPFMLRSFDEIAERIRVIRRLDFTSPKRIEATYVEHAAILAALSEGNAAKAERLMRSHINTSREEIRRITLQDLRAVTPATVPTRKDKA